MNKNSIAPFVASTREHIFVRPEDGLLILRPNKVHHLNPTAAEMLAALYAPPAAGDLPDVDALIRGLAGRHRWTVVSLGLNSGDARLGP